MWGRLCTLLQCKFTQTRGLSSSNDQCLWLAHAIYTVLLRYMVCFHPPSLQAEASTGGIYRLGNSFAGERDTLQEQFKQLSGQLYPRTAGGRSHGCCDGCGPGQQWQPGCYMEMPSVLEMLTYDSVMWGDALSLSYTLTSACGCQSTQHTVVPLLVCHHFLAEHAKRDGSLDIAAMLPAAVRACGGYVVSAGCNTCGATGAAWGVQLEGPLPEV